jgi:CHAP domain-containing protein
LTFPERAVKGVSVDTLLGQRPRIDPAGASTPLIQNRWPCRGHASAAMLLVLLVAVLPTGGCLTVVAPMASAGTTCPLMAHLKIPRPNPRNACKAIARGDNRSTYHPDSCLNFVAQMYGWRNTGWRSPIRMWRNIRPRLRHRNDTAPPAGALAIWRTSNRSGHIALVTRNGVISTDVYRRGHVNEVALHWITKHWHARYLGWVMPYFPTAS